MLGLYSTDAVFWIVLGIPVGIGLIALGAVITGHKQDGDSPPSSSSPPPPASS